jgi:hypothetical protein
MEPGMTNQMNNEAQHSAGALWEVPMSALSFPTVRNNASLKGSLAARKQFFGDKRRYAVAPIHTRFDAVEWFVWDAEHPLSDMSHAEVIRQAETLEEALRGLCSKDEVSK